MFINNFDPVAFQIISFEIRWYSLAYIAGIIIGWMLCKKVLIQKSDINEKAKFHRKSPCLKVNNQSKFFDH